MKNMALRHLSLVFPLVFLLMQAMTILHALEHSQETDSDKGKQPICEVCLNHNERLSASVSVLQIKKPLILTTRLAALIEWEIYSPVLYEAAAPRAPPSIA